LAEKSSWDRQTDGKNLVWFGEIERKLAKLSMTTFAYRSSSKLFYGPTSTTLQTLLHRTPLATAYKKTKDTFN
jgi:hypothetical protein